MLNHIETAGSRRRVKPVDYDFIGNSVHHFVLTSRSLGAIQEWRRRLDYIYQQAAYRTVLTLTDARRTVLPPLAFATHLGDLWSGYSAHPLYSRNAVLHPDAPLSELAQETLESIPGVSNQLVRFFSPSERDIAVRWLIAQD